MIRQLRRSRPRLLPTVSTRQRGQRGIVWGAAVLACIGGIAVGSKEVTVGTPALAQATSGIPSPPADAPIMVPGQRVQRPFGWIEISTFGRSEQDQNSIFTVEFLVVNASSQAVVLNFSDETRLITDGIPRAPAEISPHSVIRVQTESAMEGNATFRVRGRPGIVYIQFGTGKTGRSFLRWPD
jgi:hypothetical protein